MGKFSGNYIDCYEKRISVQQIYQMYRERRIIFPTVPSKRKPKKIENISGIVETILLGITLPVIYVSEQQNGRLLVLEADDRLRCLVEFLEGYYPIMSLEFFPELNGYKIEQLEQEFPEKTSWLYDYRFSFQVIEYTTPKYIHMQVGNYIEKWNLTREQGIRNELYGIELEWYLSFLVQNLGQSINFFSKWKLNRQYMVLRILMYCLVFEKDIPIECEEMIGLQQLLEQTIRCIEKKNDEWKRKIADAFRKATEELIDWEKRKHFGLDRERGKEQQAKTLGYLYNVVWICWKKRCEVQWGLEQVAFDRQLWIEIEKETVNSANIQKHFEEIEKRLK